ncbi:MAG: nitroreductase family protein [Thermodesulfovibrionales bacterium]
MKVLDSVKARRSVRNFREGQIPDETADALIDALIWAPSAGNLQSRKFIFVRDTRKKRELVAAALDQEFLARAALVIAGCADMRIAGTYGERGVSLYAIQDVACSLMCMMLVAQEMRLGSVWVGAFREDEVSRILGLPLHLRPVALVAVGLPQKLPTAPPRVSREEAVVWI